MTALDRFSDLDRLLNDSILSEEREPRNVIVISRHLTDKRMHDVRYHCAAERYVDLRASTALPSPQERLDHLKTRLLSKVPVLLSLS